MGKRKQLTEQHKIYVKNNLEKILEAYGAKKNNFDNWDCLNSRHSNNHKKNLTVNNNLKICCCHCGLQGDSFKVISILENLDIKKDFYKIVQKGLDILGGYSIITADKTNNVIIKEVSKKETKTNDNLLNYLNNSISQNFKKINSNYYYFKKRGITNINLLKYYKMIVGDPRRIIPKDLLPEMEKIWQYKVIIPVWEKGKVVNCLLKNTYSSNIKILNLKDLPLRIFNARYLYQLKENDILFVTEGIFDALSFENFGFKGISLNTCNFRNKFLKLLERYKNELISKNVTLIYCFDNDKAGIETTEVLRKKTLEIGINNIALSIKKYKDANEYLIKDRHNFKLQVSKLVQYISKKVS